MFWETAEGGLEGWSYLYPDSGPFRVRAVFLNSDGERRSAYLSEDELTEFPEATPGSLTGAPRRSIGRSPAGRLARSACPICRAAPAGVLAEISHAPMRKTP